MGTGHFAKAQLKAGLRDWRHFRGTAGPEQTKKPDGAGSR